jgi:hypothetical protein
VFGAGLSAAKYTFKVLIAADNAPPHEVEVSFDFDPDKRDLVPALVVKPSIIL